MRTSLRCAALAALAIPGALAAQSGLADRLELHGALNAAYGRSDTLGVFGIPQKGTSDYRVFTLQGRYRLGQKDVLVAQVFNRRLGASPLATAISDVTMQWAFWQHREGDFTVKVGRNPLPRGLYNEVRYIGTVMPFFRPPIEVQQEAFDAIDGAVVTYRKELPLGLELEQHAFGGGSENRAIANTAAGQQVRIARTENMFGGQTYLSVPFAGIRVGAYAARYAFVQPTQRGYRSNIIYSGEATVDRLKLATEHSRISGHGPSNDNRGGYYMGTVRILDGLSVAGQHAYINRKLYFANTSLNSFYPEVRTNGASAIIALPASSVLKVEHHWRTGWSFDTPTAPIASQTPTSFTMSPKRDARYFLVSVAASF